MSLSNLVKNKKYKEALNLVNRSDMMEEHNKNIVTSLIESIIAIDNSNLNEV
jgi:NifU-like protein involved in Fe-S cluster formation